MLIKTILHVCSCYLVILAVVTLVYSIINKNAAVCKALAKACILGIVWLIVFAGIGGSALGVGVGFEVFLYWILGLIGAAFYVIALILNAIKGKKITKAYFASTFTLPKPFWITVAVLLALPVIALSARVIRDYSLIKTSDILIVYESRGNGGIGDSELFAFSVKGDKVTQFDLCIDLMLDKVVPKTAREEDVFFAKNMILGSYLIKQEDDDIVFYHEDRTIFRFEDGNGRYFNVEPQECYYNLKTK